MATAERAQDEAKRLHWRPRNPRLAPASGAARGAAAPGTGAGDAADQWTLARWRRESGRIAPFIPVLVLLEAANWYLLDVTFGWVLPGTLLPGLAALALIVVLIGTVFAGTLLANREMRSHRLRLRATLIGLIALQFTVNTIVGFDTARAHMPPVAAQFFGLDPIVMARLVGAVMGGSLALITFSYLLVVAAVVDKIMSPLSIVREVNVVLRHFDDDDARTRTAGDAVGPSAPGANGPTVDMGGGQWTRRSRSDDETEADPAAWDIRR